jgi:hypothetical protein
MFNGFRNPCIMILDNEKLLNFKQANHLCRWKSCFLFFRVFCDHWFHAKAKSENKWKNKCLTMH